MCPSDDNIKESATGEGHRGIFPGTGESFPKEVTTVWVSMVEQEPDKHWGQKEETIARPFTPSAQPR